MLELLETEHDDLCLMFFKNYGSSHKQFSNMTDDETYKLSPSYHVENWCVYLNRDFELFSLSYKVQIAILRGWKDSKFLNNIKQTIDKSIERHDGVVFFRLNSRSSKDVTVKATSWAEMFDTLHRSERIKEDIGLSIESDETIPICLVVSKWIELKTEARIFFEGMEDIRACTYEKCPKILNPDLFLDLNEVQSIRKHYNDMCAIDLGYKKETNDWIVLEVNPITPFLDRLAFLRK